MTPTGRFAARAARARWAPAALAVLLFPAAAPAQAPEAPCIEELESRLEALAEQERYAEALAVARDFERAAEAKFGAETECHARALLRQGTLLQPHGRLAEGGRLLERALAIYRKRLTADHPEVTLAISNLGLQRFWMRQYAEAARLHAEALDLRRNARPLDEIAVAASLQNLADAYRYLERDASLLMPLYRQSLEIRRRLLPANDWRIAQSLQNLAAAQENVGDFKGAGINLAAALEIYLESQPDDHSTIGGVTSRLAVALFRQGRAGEAEKQFRESLRRHRTSRWTQDVALGTVLDDFAAFQIARGKLEEAKSLASEALAIWQKVLPPGHAKIARTLSNLSDIAWRQGELGEALEKSRRAKDMLVALGGLDTLTRFILQRHVGTTWSVFAGPDSGARAELLDDAFMVAQHAVRTDTALTVSRMTERFAARDPRLRALLKEVDDIDREQTGLDQLLTHAFKLPKDKGAEVFSEIRAKIAANRERRERIVGEAKAAFPALFRLVGPQPLGVSEVQSLLRPDEVLVSFMVGFEEVHTWAVTREKAWWKRAKLGPQDLEAAVKTLRAGLDVDPEEPTQAKLPLFDLGLAHRLYVQLLGEVEPLLRGRKKVLLAASGPLSSVPLHVLVTKPPAVPQPSRRQPAAYQQAEWLVRTHAVSVLPAVASLEARRRPPPAPAERRPLIGFANPLPGPAPAAAKVAAAASVRGRPVRRRSRAGGVPKGLWRGASVNYEALRKHLGAVPLPGTEGELRAVAEALGAPDEDVRVGAAATETAVKEAGLASYRIVYFATHGYVAGSFGQGEPSLALTVPEAPGEKDDGLLTASEIAQLTLDADWVVLSACDTAAGATRGAEGLSGLARAFFHAGARSLVVSHWPVSDQDAKQLMITTFGAIRTDGRIGRAEALRRAMLKQIADARPQAKGLVRWNAYPANWGPFDLVAADPE